MPKRKKVTMLVTVTVPAETTPAEARREVRTLVNEQCNYFLDYNEIRAVKVSPAPKQK